MTDCHKNRASGACATFHHLAAAEGERSAGSTFPSGTFPAVRTNQPFVRTGKVVDPKVRTAEGGAPRSAHGGVPGASWREPRLQHLMPSAA